MEPPHVYLGTSGFSFDDWKGVIYPERLSKSRWLIHYEQELGFNSLEINYTYYSMPSHRTMESLLKKTTDDFRFCIKTHRRMTHDVIQHDGTVRDDPGTIAMGSGSGRSVIQSG